MFGLFGMGNFGNDASLVAGLQAVARVLPGARVSTISSDAIDVERRHGVPGVSIDLAGPFDRLGDGGRIRTIVTRPVVEVGRWAAAVRHLRDVDLVVVPGTGILDDYGQRPTQLPLAVLRWSLAARLAGSRLLYFGIGAGPILHPVSRRLMRAALAQADFCSYRDAGSLAFMAGIGRRTTHDEVWPDLVFALPTGDTSTGAAAGPLRVAIGVMTYRGWSAAGRQSDRILERYVDGIVALASRVRAAGHTVCLVIGELGDLPAAETVSGRLGDPVELFRATDFDDVRAALSCVDVLIASRYHNLIAALVAGVPVVSLSYADKNDQLLATFGLGELCQHVDGFDVDLAMAHLAHVTAHHASLVAAVTRTAAALHDDVCARMERQLAS